MISCSLPAGKGRPHFPRQYYIFSDRLLVLSAGRLLLLLGSCEAQAIE